MNPLDNKISEQVQFITQPGALLGSKRRHTRTAAPRAGMTQRHTVEDDSWDLFSDNHQQLDLKVTLWLWIADGVLPGGFIQ